MNTLSSVVKQHFAEYALANCHKLYYDPDYRGGGVWLVALDHRISIRIYVRLDSIMVNWGGCRSAGVFEENLAVPLADPGCFGLVEGLLQKLHDQLS